MERKKTFKFRGTEYQIEFPTVGQYIDIESEKLNHSNGQFTTLIQAGTLSGLRAVQIIESISIYSILCPQLVKELKVNSFKDIDAKDFIELLKIYSKEISPWYNEWFKEFNDLMKEE